jgi:hypothetical protein
MVRFALPEIGTNDVVAEGNMGIAGAQFGARSFHPGFALEQLGDIWWYNCTGK